MIPNKAKTFEGEIQAFSERCLSSPLEMGPPGEVFMSHQKTQWRDYVSKLAWGCLGVSQGKLEDVAGGRSGLAPKTRPQISKMNQWMYL